MVTYGKRRLLAAFALTTVGAVVLAGCSGGSEPETEESSGPVTLTLTTNSITGGKNAAEADWIADWVVPEFEKAMKADGKNVTVEFQPQGVDDEDYKTKIALDLQSGKGADIIGMDGIWVGEFAEAGYIKPLSDVGGSAVDDWDGWEQIPDAVQNALSFDGDRYGVPQGADGRVLYYNKDLFAQAGLDEDWAPESWEDILDAATDLKKIDGVTPIQLNAGTAMGEATTMQGLLPMLVGTGEQVFEDGKWIGATKGMEEALDLYKTIYVDEGLGDPVLQQEASGRDTSFQLFAEGKIGILLEGDYFWRSVINPAEGVGTAPMADRDTAVGYAKIPAIKPGKGINDQDYVSMSGGTGRVLNPNSKHPELAWELLAFMNSPEAYEARAAGTLAISPRNDVNEKLLSSDPMLTFVSEEVLPITAYRPGLAAYPQVSVLLQQATLDVTTGTSVDDALKTYVRGLEGVVGPDAISE
ncbi:sugar ABC transporter substrate-binding protein [Microbacterium oxydans]|uniref:sugar ABC transporter substrate-binding protein n=1 Tax=Microbacterium oxydans TaxID=82380 RepID=UPI0024AE6B46|nr:extracellular solute-binding protein [Microbacterium oxydans]